MGLTITLGRALPIGLVLTCCTGCWGPIPLRNQPLRDPRPWRRITADGNLVLLDGTRLRLAGIVMKPETKLVGAILADVRRAVGEQVEIVQTQDDQSVWVYYRQQVFHCGNEFILPHPLTIFYFEDTWTRGCVNDMLVRDGLARTLPDARRPEN